MTKATMPERIFLQGDAEDLDDVSWGRDRIWEDDVEYIRADLVHGDANEPLADGQYRWVRLIKGGELIPATIRKDWFYKDRFIYFICGSEVEDYVADCYEWGPVIRPPEVG